MPKDAKLWFGVVLAAVYCDSVASRSTICVWIAVAMGLAMIANDTIQIYWFPTKKEKGNIISSGFYREK